MIQVGESPLLLAAGQRCVSADLIARLLGHVDAGASASAGVAAVSLHAVPVLQLYAHCTVRVVFGCA